jgi:hypothetical protein
MAETRPPNLESEQRVNNIVRYTDQAWARAEDKRLSYCSAQLAEEASHCSKLHQLLATTDPPQAGKTRGEARLPRQPGRG